MRFAELQLLRNPPFAEFPQLALIPSRATSLIGPINFCAGPPRSAPFFAAAFPSPVQRLKNTTGKNSRSAAVASGGK